MAAGWAGATALVAGTVTAASIAGGLMVAGGAMAAIGAVTGNKKLTKIGGIVSLAGGITSLAAGAISAASEGASAAFDAAGSAAATDAAQAASNLTTAPGGSGVLAAQDAALSQIGAGTPIVEAVGVGGGAIPTVGEAAISPLAINSAAQPASTLAPGGASAAAGTSPASGGGLLDSVKSGMTWLEKNPRLAQAGSGLLKSGLEAYGQSEAQKDRVRMEEEAAKRARDRLNNSLVGVRVPTYQPPPQRG